MVIGMILSNFGTTNSIPNTESQIIVFLFYGNFLSLGIF